MQNGAHGALERHAVAEAVRAIEQAGPLEDGQAMREAFAAHAGREQRLLARAEALGARLGMDREWTRWRQLGSGVVLVLTAVVVLAALGLAQAVLGDARQVNALAAFVSLLGLHALTLLAWLVGLLLPLPSGGAALGRIALAATARLPLDRGPHAIELLRATTAVLRRARLAPWAFGFVSHTIWALSFAVLLAALWFAFSVKAYRLTWETTILEPTFFVQFVRASGWLPAVLGVPLPDAASLLQPDAPGADHRAWAWWLMGCVAVYGLALRALLALLSWAVWRCGEARLRLDLADPYYRRLLARFDAMEPALVVDAEQRPALAAAPHAATPAQPFSAARALIGFELPPELPWPTEALQAIATELPATLSCRIAGAQRERVAVLKALADARPDRLLLVCHGPSSPDRGTARFLREAQSYCMHTGLLLAGAMHDTDAARWRDWLAASELASVGLLADADTARAWLETTR
jgi:hypothetical protein